MRIPVLLLSVLLISCSGLNTAQKREYKEWKSSGLAQEVKSEGLAAGLNVLPGFGDFYNGNTGLGVVNLLAWPLSILWAPVGGANGAEEVNYYESKAVISKLEKNKTESINHLLQAFTTQQISKEHYIFLNQKFQQTDLSEFSKVKYYQEYMHLFQNNPRLPAQEK